MASRIVGDEGMMSGFSRPTSVRRLAALLALLAMMSWLPPAQSQDAAVPVASGENEPMELVIANRPITMLRVPAYGASPAERAEAIEVGVDALLARGGPLAGTTRTIPDGVAVLVDGRILFRVLHEDVNRESGETTAMAADAAVRNLTLALDGIRESRDSRAMFSAIGYTLLATVVLAALLWLTARANRALQRRVRSFVQSRSGKLVPGWSQQVVGRSGIAELAVVPVRLAACGDELLIVYERGALVLEFFP